MPTGLEAGIDSRKLHAGSTGSHANITVVFQVLIFVNLSPNV